MITNFEEITAPLSIEEKELLLCVYDVVKKIDKKNPIKAPNLIQRVKQITNKEKFAQARLRKIINFIRANGILPVIATSNGYYTSYETNEILKEIKSLNERAEAIRFASDGLKIFLEKKEQLSLMLD
ncbi:MAG: hypothetical protein KBE38_15220 [Ignavibacterium sp.]|nr:hypothetical protein [Ignavibacterium sp.]